MSLICVDRSAGARGKGESESILAGRNERSGSRCCAYNKESAIRALSDRKRASNNGGARKCQAFFVPLNWLSNINV
jgi:hypothetical protein